MLTIRNLNASYIIDRYTAKNIKEALISEEIARYTSILKKGLSRDLAKYEKILKKFEEVSKKYMLSESFEIYVLNDVNLNFEKGILGVVGESGSGKSTLALLILGLKRDNLKVSSGEIIFDCVNMLADPVAARRMRGSFIGYVGQGTYTYLNPLMESAYQIFESAEVASQTREEAINRFLEAIRKADLDKRILLSYPKKLSGGEIRKIAIAIAIAKKLKLLVGDEPFRNLDTYHAMRLALYLKELVEEANASAIIFSHNLALLAQIADEIAVLYNGVIVERGPTQKIFENPKHPYTKGLIGALPDIRNPKKKLVYVPGEPLPKIIKPDFCPFFNRCPYADESCLEGIPKPRIVDGVEVRCKKIDELAQMTPQEFWEKYI